MTIRILFIVCSIYLFLFVLSCGNDSDTILGPSEIGYHINGSFDNYSPETSKSPIPYSILISTDVEDWLEEPGVIEGKIESNGHFSVFISANDFFYRFIVEFSLACAGNMSMELRNERGQMIKTLLDDFLNAGYHRVVVDLHDRIDINYLTDDILNFADKYWNYTDAVDSKGDDIKYNYWYWLEYQFIAANLIGHFIGPYDYAAIDSLLDDNSFLNNIGLLPHHLPSSKTPLYYVMIGKYSQFIYGWEDIDDVDENGNPINPSIQEHSYYNENIYNIKSPLRDKYCEMLDKASKSR